MVVLAVDDRQRAACDDPSSRLTSPWRLPNDQRHNEWFRIAESDADEKGM
jgi:hypothetical protein